METEPLPDYVLINDQKIPEKTRAVLREPAQKIHFPLSEEDKAMLKILEEKFDQEENCAGLALPQLGFGKQAFVFAVEASPELKKWRPDLEQTIGKSIWINPTYKPIGDEKHTDYEGCFSVLDLAGPVARYKTIEYTAYLMDGTFISGQATGFFARVVQHEIDHLNGTLFIDYVPEEDLKSTEVYRKMRADAIAKD